jgi:hypothetical protein
MSTGTTVAAAPEMGTATTEASTATGRGKPRLARVDHAQ